MRRVGRLAGVVILAAAAGGCQLVLGIGGTKLDRDGGPADTSFDQDDRGAPDLDLGGDHSDALDSAPSGDGAPAPDGPGRDDGAAPEMGRDDASAPDTSPAREDGPAPEMGRDDASAPDTSPAREDGPAPATGREDASTPETGREDASAPETGREDGSAPDTNPGREDGPSPGAGGQDAPAPDAGSGPDTGPYVPLIGGTIASRLGGCLAVGEPVVIAGAPKTGAALPRSVVLAPCNDTDPLQRWQRDALGRFLAPHIPDGALTSSSDQPAVTTGAPRATVDLAADPPPPTQVWTLEGVRIVGVGDLCVDVPNGDFSIVQQVQLYKCQSSDNQKWNVSLDGEIRHGSSCLDVPNGTLLTGNPINIYQCNMSVVQRFTFQPGGSLKFGGLCASAADPTAGSSNRLLTIERCAPASFPARAAQTFRVEGPLHVGAACLDAGPGASVSIVSTVSIVPCSGADSQTWIWRF